MVSSLFYKLNSRLTRFLISFYYKNTAYSRKAQGMHTQANLMSPIGLVK